MLIRLIAAAVLTLTCLLVSGCPEQEENPPTAPEQSASATDPADVSTPDTPAEVAEPEADEPVEEPEPFVADLVPNTSPVQTVIKLVDTINSGDHTSFELLLHPEGPAHDELVSKFEDFDRAHAKVVLQDCSVTSEEQTVAMVSYDLKVVSKDGSQRPESESGKFRMQFEGGNWLVWSSS